MHLKILIHDYSGHPFQVQLSRALAKRGHEVHHLFSGSFQTPHGDLSVGDKDPEGFHVEAIDLETPFEKYSYLKRRSQEQEYGRMLAGRVAAIRPDIAISSNTPLDAQNAFHRQCRKLGIPFIFWLQDIYGVAIRRTLRGKIPILGDMIGRFYESLERRILRESDCIVAITSDFVPALDAMGVEPSRISVIENWAPLDELPELPRNNDWSRRHGVDGQVKFLYSGTLGLKHNPALLAGLGARLDTISGTGLIVASEGPGADFLKAAIQQQKMRNMHVMGFQPYDVYPQVLASADVLVAILEPDAGVYSVPSKVLSYLCAGRPILAAIPAENLAAKIITGADAGIVVSPNDPDGFVAAAERLVGDQALREKMGHNARAYAEKTFNIETITNNFQVVIDRGLSGAPHYP